MLVAAKAPAAFPTEAWFTFPSLIYCNPHGSGGGFGGVGVCVMDVGALAAGLVGARLEQVQTALAARMLRMNAESAASIVQVLEAAQENIERLAGAGLGVNVDISV